MPGTGPGLIIGKTYLFEQVGFPAFTGTVIGCEPDLAQPVHVWMNRTGTGGGLSDPARNPILVILGTNWIVSPVPP